MQGEPVLGHLSELGRDLLTALNAPDGDCPVCLLPLESSGLGLGFAGNSGVPAGVHSA